MYRTGKLDAGRQRSINGVFLLLKAAPHHKFLNKNFSPALKLYLPISVDIISNSFFSLCQQWNIC